MAVIFPRWTNRLPLALVGGALGGACVVVGAVWYWFSPWFTDVGYSPEQPVPFSHAQHVGGLGMDCRYCHNTVERGAKAAIPPTATCIGCHSVVKADSRLLEPIRESARRGIPVYEPDPDDPRRPVEFGWVRVHMLPDYAYFDHSVHVSAAVGCVECHGRIDKMEQVRQAQPLSMGWCLECHRDPYPRLRPRQRVTDMTWDAATAQYDPHADPVTPPGGCAVNGDCPSGYCDREARRCVKRQVEPPENCSGCHR